MNQPKVKSLFNRVVKSAGWVFFGKIIGRLLEFVKAIILARLLVPEDFGLFGLVMLAIIMLDTFSQTGFKAALVQHEGNTHEYLDTAWTVQVIRGILIALLLFLISPAAGWFFKEPRIVQPLRVMCLAPVIQGFINIAIIYFEKELEFQKQFSYEMISSVVSLVIGILLAYELRSVWALIWSNLAGVSMRLIMSYVLLSYRPRFRLVRSQMRELFRFGKWVSGYFIVLSSWQQLDKFLIGKLLGPVALGLYQIAQRISDLPVSNIAAASVNFTFPAYSKIQQEKERLGRAFLDVLEALMSFVLPLTTFIFFASHDIVIGLLGEQWKNTIIPLQILSVAAFLTAFDVMSTALFMSVGKPNIEFWKNLLKLAIMVITIYPLTITWGLSGACTSVVLSSAAILPVWSIVRTITRISWGDILRRLIFPSTLALSTTLAINLTHTLVDNIGILSLTTAVAITSLFFILTTVTMGKILKRGLYVHLSRIMRQVSLK